MSKPAVGCMYCVFLKWSGDFWNEEYILNLKCMSLSCQRTLCTVINNCWRETDKRMLATPITIIAGLWAQKPFTHGVYMHKKGSGCKQTGPSSLPHHHTSMKYVVIGCTYEDFCLLSGVFEKKLYFWSYAICRSSQIGGSLGDCRLIYGLIVDGILAENTVHNGPIFLSKNPYSVSGIGL